MMVMILEKVPRSLRGELTRWLLEVQTGVFVGTLSATVRDLLWEKCLEQGAGGRCCQVYRANNEQGFLVRLAGDETRTLIDRDGLTLVAVKNAAWARIWQQELRRQGHVNTRATAAEIGDTSGGSTA